MLDRRTALFALAGCLVAIPAFAAEPILRINGAVSHGNWGGLGAFLVKSEGQVVGLNISFRERRDGPDGSIVAGVLDGAFDGYLAGGDLSIHAERGFSVRNGTIAFDGFFRVEYGGMHQGITGYGLAPVGRAEAAGPVRDLDIDRLRADIRKQ